MCDTKIIINHKYVLKKQLFQYKTFFLWLLYLLLLLFAYDFMMIDVIIML